MQYYTVEFDQKVTIWSRETVTIEAETIEQAIELAKAKKEVDGSDNFEYLTDTEEILEPKDNDNQYTEEIRVDDELIETNYPLCDYLPNP